jgi:hypothetical protein
MLWLHVAVVRVTHVPAKPPKDVMHAPVRYA